jgi:dihydroorotase
MHYDLLLKNGRVIDPSQTLDCICDVAIADRRIAAVGTLDSQTAKQVLDISGKLVTPGLIDIHVHVAEHEESENAQADTIGVRMGVTTIVDAGTSGILAFPGYKKLIDAESPETRVLFIIRASQVYSFGGFVSLKVGADLAPENYDVRKAAKLYERYRDAIVGFKCTAPLGSATDSESIPLKLSKQITRALGLPLTVHLGWVPFSPWLSTPDILDKLDSGDIATHIFRRKGSILDVNDRVHSAVFAAQARGVRFDIGHGTGSFDFNVAKSALEQGIVPFTISSDLMDKSAITGPIFSLTETMTKFLYLGLELSDVIAMTTCNAARAINREAELGSLAIGRVADLSILDYREGTWKLSDGVNIVHWEGRKLIPQYTIRAGTLSTCRYPENSLRREEMSCL